MVWFCATGCTKIRENFVPDTLKKRRIEPMDFRKADPTYTNFEPATAEEAINKFYRHKNLGVPPHLWPEVFVDCAGHLPPAELQKFQDWLVNPQGESTAPMLKHVDQQNEAVRLQLLKEATARDAATTCIMEEAPIVENYMDVDVDDEKVPMVPPSESASSMMVNLSVSDFDMVTSSER